MKPVSPVIPGLEEYETVIAKDQTQYLPLPAFVGSEPDVPVMSRWRLTDEEREKVATGADIVLTLLTFGSSLQPIVLEVVGVDEAPFGSLGV